MVAFDPCDVRIILTYASIARSTELSVVMEVKVAYHILAHWSSEQL